MEREIFCEIYCVNAESSNDFLYLDVVVFVREGLRLIFEVSVSRNSGSS